MGTLGIVLWEIATSLSYIIIMEDRNEKKAEKNNVMEFDSTLHISILHDDVIKWKHFPRYWPFVRGIHRSPVNSSHKGQWRGALMLLWSAPESTVE